MKCVDEQLIEDGDIPASAARKIMDSAEFRVVDLEQEWGGKTERWNALQMLHNGKWVDMSRTDLCDNVCTTEIATRTKEQWIKHYRRGIRIGARWQDDGSFSVIDQATDG